MIKPENRKYYLGEWAVLRKAVIAERGNRCEVCKKITPVAPRVSWLTVHHKDRNPANNDPYNLVVCCPKCHFDQERLINVGHFNPNQLALWKDTSSI